MSERVIMRIISAVVGLALIGAGLYLVAIDRAEHVSTLITIGIAALGLAGVVLPSPFGSSSEMPPKRKGPRVPPLPVLLVLVLIVGCDDPVRDNARAATITAGALTAGGDIVMAARAASLDRVEAQYPSDPEHDEQLELEAARWQPVLLGLDGARSALLVWIDSLELAQVAGGGGALLGPVITLGARTLRLIGDAFALASSLGVTGLPTLPTLGGAQ
jgi:hypothetical protein